LDREILFNSLVDLVRKQFDRLKKIEKDQSKAKKEFPEIIRNIDKLNNLQIGELLILPAIRKKKLALTISEQFGLHEIIPIRNALIRLLK